MKTLGIVLIIFGIILIIFPEILAYLLGGFFIFIGINILIFFKTMKNTTSKENFVKFGNYKIYR